MVSLRAVIRQLEHFGLRSKKNFKERRDTTTGAPVSDPACWRGTLDLAGSETGAPVAVIRRAQESLPRMKVTPHGFVRCFE